MRVHYPSVLFTVTPARPGNTAPDVGKGPYFTGFPSSFSSAIGTTVRLG